MCEISAYFGSPQAAVKDLDVREGGYCAVSERPRGLALVVDTEITLTSAPLSDPELSSDPVTRDIGNASPIFNLAS
jgi:hypothetical protein